MEKEVEQVLMELQRIPWEMGIYPAAVECQDKEKSYKERDGFKNGWNECVMEYGRKVSEIVHSPGRPWERCDKLFAAAGEDIFDYDTERKVWSVFLNDTWYYSCADGEDIPDEEKNTVASYFRQFGEAGVMYWVYLKRGHMPEIKTTKEKVLAVKGLIEGDSWLQKLFGKK